MGIDRTFGVAFAKSQIAVGNKLPDRGSVFLSLADRDKAAGLIAARRFADLGFTIVATAGTAAACEAEGIPVGAVVAKLGPGEPAGQPPTSSASTPSTSSPPARSTSSSTPPGAAAPGPTAPTSASPPAPTASPASRRSPPPSPPPPASPNGAPRSTGSAPCRSTTSTPSSASPCSRNVKKRSAKASHEDPPEVDLTCRLGPIALPNPIVTASGTYGYSDEVARLGDPSKLGAVTAKSLSPFPWEGNPPPRVWEATAGMLNSVGLQNPGVEAWLEHDLPPLLARGRGSSCRSGAGRSTTTPRRRPPSRRRCSS